MDSDVLYCNGISGGKQVHDIFKAFWDKVSSNWEDTRITCVPGVMLQVRHVTKEVEYRIHWFNDASETYIHNHGYPFTTLCLHGEYVESSWELDKCAKGNVYCFLRETGNRVKLNGTHQGNLKRTQIRKHFPGNVMHIASDRYHSIKGSGEVVTFVTIHKKGDKTPTHIWSSSPDIHAPTEEVREATECERKAMYMKLLSLPVLQQPARGS